MAETEQDQPNVDEEADSPQPPVFVNRAVWIAWWLGTVLIVLSWVDVVSPQIGWVGFGIACVSVVVSVIANRYWRMP